MALDLFQQSQKDQTAYAERYSGAHLPSWLELHSNEIKMASWLLGIIFLLVILYIFRRRLLFVLVEILAGVVRFWRVIGRWIGQLRLLVQERLANKS